MKNLLVISYSQSGQLDQILKNLISGFGSEWAVERVHVKMKKPFSFPWNSSRFFDAMPESVLENPAPIENPEFKKEKYDLIVFGYQPWFLSPSIPATSLLTHRPFQSIMQNTDVITVIGARNMWLNAHKSVSKMIAGAEGKHIGHIPFTDKASNLLSAVSILHWMMTGKKTKKWGIFPKPGVSDEDISGAEKFGQLISQNYPDQKNDLQKKIISTGKIHIPISILFIESRAKKLFNIWANLIIRKGTTPSKRKRWLVIFKYYLIFALFIISPIVLTVYFILFRPFLSKSIRTARESYYYQG